MTKALIFILILTFYVNANDWPRFMGPQNNDQTNASSGFTSDLEKWGESWKINVGVGYSAITVVGNKAYTMGHDGIETGSIYCLDANTGKQVWKYTYKGLLINKLHLGGPNASIEIEDDLLYCLSKDGKAYCLNRKNGTLVWKINLQNILGIKQPQFGFAGSPVIYKNQLIFTCGKACGIDKTSGKVIWTSSNTHKEEDAYYPGHASPVIFTFKNKEYVLLYTGTGLEVLKLTDGSLVDRYSVTARFKMTASTPIVYDNGSKILLSWSAYSASLSFSEKGLQQIWKKKGMIRTMQNSVLIDKVVYGVNGLHGSKRGEMAAVNIKDGKYFWSEPNIKWSQITAIGDTLLCMGIRGELVAVKADKSKFIEISRKRLFTSTCWTKVTYANGKIYARNNKGDVVCLSIK